MPARRDPPPAPSALRSGGERRVALALSARAAATACAAYLAARLLRLEGPLWSPVSALIVLQASPRGTMRAAADRMLGTLVGAATAVVAAVALAPLGAPMTAQIAVAVGLAALGAALVRPAARVATWTSVIVLMSTIAPGHPVANALWRVAGVVVGALVGAAAGVLVPPARPADALRRQVGAALAAMADALRRAAAGEDPAEAWDAVEAGLRRCEALLADARRLRAPRDGVEPAVRALRRLARSLVTLGHAAGPARLADPDGRAVEAVADGATGALAAHLDALADAVDGRAERPDPAELDGIVAGVARAVRRLRATGGMRRLSDADAQALYLRRFALERAARDAAELGHRALAAA